MARSRTKSNAAKSKSFEQSPSSSLQKGKGSGVSKRTKSGSTIDGAVKNFRSADMGHPAVRSGTSPLHPLSPSLTSTTQPPSLPLRRSKRLNPDSSHEDDGAAVPMTSFISQSGTETGNAPLLVSPNKRRRIIAKPKAPSRQVATSIYDAPGAISTTSGLTKSNSEREPHVKLEVEHTDDESMHEKPNKRRKKTSASRPTRIPIPPNATNNTATTTTTTTTTTTGNFEPETSNALAGTRHSQEYKLDEPSDNFIHRPTSQQLTNSSNTSSSHPHTIPSPPASPSAHLPASHSPVPNNHYRHTYARTRNRSYHLNISVQPPFTAKVDEELHPPPVVRLHIRDLARDIEIPAEAELNMLTAQVSVHDENGVRLAPPLSDHLKGEWSGTPSLLHELPPPSSNLPADFDENLHGSVRTRNSNDEISSIVSVAPISRRNLAPPPPNPRPNPLLPNHQGSFVMFPNLILRQTGNFRLKITLFALDGGDQTGSPGRTWVAEVMTNIIRIQSEDPDIQDMTPEEEDFLRFLQERGVNMPI